MPANAQLAGFSKQPSGKGWRTPYESLAESLWPSKMLGHVGKLRRRAENARTKDVLSVSTIHVDKHRRRDFITVCAQRVGMTHCQGQGVFL